MSIPESQLDTWSHQGSVTQSSATYQTVRTALCATSAVYAAKEFNVFLQGSYGNDTNIYAESDVDIVIRLDSIFSYDVTNLQPEHQALFRQVFSGTPGYTFAEFKQGVVLRLETAFGADNVTAENKAIKIKANASRRSADVVVCYEYRRYTRFVNVLDCSYVSGIFFPSASSGNVINYPKAHSENCTAKHQATNSWFKPMVRIVKNMRSRMIDDGLLAKGVAPSYYIEGLLYSVPNDKFGVNYATTFCNCVNWLWQADRSTLWCANGQYQLLGNSNVQWSSGNCDQFLGALVGFWNNW